MESPKILAEIKKEEEKAVKKEAEIKKTEEAIKETEEKKAVSPKPIPQNQPEVSSKPVSEKIIEVIAE